MGLKENSQFSPAEYSNDIQMLRKNKTAYTRVLNHNIKSQDPVKLLSLKKHEIKTL